MSVNYEVMAADKDFISVIFYFHEFEGGAGGTHWADSLNYDLNRNVALKLADLFTPKSNYLKVISAYSVRELKKAPRIREVMKQETGTWVEEGAGPRAANFSDWNISPDGLKITFDPHRFNVSANTGYNKVVIPFSVLKPIIKPDGLLARFTK